MKDIVLGIFGVCFGVLVLLACLVGVLYIVKKVSDMRRGGLL